MMSPTNARTVSGSKISSAFRLPTLTSNTLPVLRAPAADAEREAFVGSAPHEMVRQSTVSAHSSMRSLKEAILILEKERGGHISVTETELYITLAGCSQGNRRNVAHGLMFQSSHFIGIPNNLTIISHKDLLFLSRWRS